VTPVPAPTPEVPEVPFGLVAAGRGEAWAAWLDLLPRLAADLLADWALTPDGEATHGRTSLVVPVRTADGERAVLKVTFPHRESETEHLALRRWAGRGAVRLLRADPHRSALLLERLKPRDLHDLPPDDAVATVARLYRRLHTPALPQPTRLSDELRRWADGLAALPRSAPVPRRYVEQAASLAADLAGDPGIDARLLHGDLHYANVLAALREPWLAIDPKPLSGDPHWEVAPLLWNRWREAVATGDLRGALRRRLWIACDVAGLDEDRARALATVRVMVNARWEVVEAAEAGITPDRDWLTRQVAIAKAVQR
jgi:streptomycin 6-kinase